MAGLPGSSGLIGSEAWWKFLWRVELPHKVKVFIWKACHNLIPTMVNLTKRGVPLKPIFPLCKKKKETTLHVVWGCKS
ncbi:hypothetical protein Dsin_008542 [Dipteronia sinensis]|uniref:Reverse transcriptase zinc-binding domain-containing protein n=1 Tax=Dipteronia sinensis TaxID=43782 RepID=A0AAE0AQ46_9ROSI|nr:hypothetical protein Dsin_008542 [Dipteronia sinensis]